MYIIACRIQGIKVTGVAERLLKCLYINILMCFFFKAPIMAFFLD